MQTHLRTLVPNPDAEWLEADGLGGFASGTVSGIRTRRYHGLLLPALTPPTGRCMLVNGFEAWVETAAGTESITSHRYEPEVLHPDGVSRLERFAKDPWPTWWYRMASGRLLRQEIFVSPGSPVTWMSWTMESPAAGETLRLRPLISGRDYHALHHRNGGLRTNSVVRGRMVDWAPYDGVPKIRSVSNGDFSETPDWYHRFLYDEERSRGLDCIEDLFSPGELGWDLSAGPAIWILGTGDAFERWSDEVSSLEDSFQEKRQREIERRRALGTDLDRAAEAYLVDGRHGRTIMAGYPWFTDWGRDTFISLRGLCLARGRLDDARQILLNWAGQVSLGMVPNRFPDHGEAPEFNSADASLWYVIAAYEYLEALGAASSVSAGDDSRGRAVVMPERPDMYGATDATKILRAAMEIVEGYARGARHGIRMEADGLLACGEPGVQLTWMDARVGDHVVTPRIGKPVEIQALWINVVRIAAKWKPAWQEVADMARETFERRFWNEELGCLVDVVDADHVPGRTDCTMRPNQVFAVGGLPFPLLEGERARRLVKRIEDELWTPMGLRSLAATDPRYCPGYRGGVAERDGAYHQGTAWLWLVGPWVEAWVRAHGNTEHAKREARVRFLRPMEPHFQEAGLGHLSEIADGDAPHAPKGCPFQAWSIAEWLRLDRSVLRLQDNGGATERTASQGTPGRVSVRPGRRARRLAGIPSDPSMAACSKSLSHVMEVA